MNQPNPIVFYGAQWCGDCRRAKALLEREGVEFTYVDLVAQPAEAATAERIAGRKNIPVIAFADGSFLVEPSNAELLAKLGK